jgi:hypothetical protein
MIFPEFNRYVGDAVLWPDASNALYPKYKQALLNKEADMDTDIIKATLIDSADYTYGSAHASYATDIATSAAKVAVSPQLTSPTIVDGVFDTADFTWTAVTGDPSEAIVLWDDTTTSPTADLLVAFYDTGMNSGQGCLSLPMAGMTISDVPVAA